MNIFNRLIAATLPFVPKPIVAKVADRYIAGELLPDAVSTVRRLNSGKAMATVDVLGEDTATRDDAIAAREECKRVLQEISRHSLDANLSVKLTQIGLKISRDFCESNLREILDVARLYNNFIRLDMEDHTCTDDTLFLYRRARTYYDRVGVVLQSYLRRSEEDARRLAAEGANVRVCKGIYNEPAALAFKDRRTVQENFIRLLKIFFKSGSYVGIATHDDVLIHAAEDMVHSFRLREEAYEFQMLLGVRPERRDALLSKGHRLRVYVPYGKHWYAYSIRRLKENPQIAGYVFKAIFAENSA